jgi:hypothetical protein
MHDGPHFTKKMPFVAAAAQVVAGLALLSSLQAQAQIDPKCRDSSSTTRGNGAVYTGFCSGPWLGLLNGSSSTELDRLTDAFDDQWKGRGKSNDSNANPFSNNPAGLLSGTLTFNAPVKNSFAIGLQGATNELGKSWYAFYLFDGGSTGVSSLAFDTMGIFKSNEGAGSRSPELAFALLYLPLNPVPEPATNALLLAGLGALAWVAHRRTVKALPTDGAATA